MRNLEQIEREGERAEFLRNVSDFADAVLLAHEKLRPLPFLLRYMVLREWIRGFFVPVEAGDDE